MWTSAAATESVALDPTALALLSIFGGVAVTVVAGFIGAWIQGRREHSRWVRSQRYIAYIAILETLVEIETAYASDDSPEVLYRRLNQRGQAAAILGTKDVAAAFAALPISGSPPYAERERLLRAMQSALGATTFAFPPRG